jgi:protein arginine kinase
MGSQSPSWLDSNAPRSDMVLSSRVRLARNLTHMSFCNTASAEELRRIVALVAPAVESCPQMIGGVPVTIEQMSPEALGVLVEDHLISKELAHRKTGAAAVYTPGGGRTVMINEEDHVRIQAIEAGFQLGRAYETADEIEDGLGEQIEFAFDDTLGFLTACPTNVGTGMRASVMLHLPGLALTNQMAELLPGVSSREFAIRGFYGEGTDTLGNFYQVSNHVTLGRTEHEIIRGLEAEVESILEEERAARETLLVDQRRRCEDLMWRAVGTLTQVRILSYEEFMGLLSHVRLGVVLGVLDMYDLGMLNRLMIEMQPAHVAAALEGDHDDFAGDSARADMVRAAFSG